MFVHILCTWLLSLNVLRKHMCAVKIFTGKGHGVTSNEESNSTANSSGRKFLYNSKGLDVISLLAKYYLPLAHVNHVVKLDRAYFIAKLNEKFKI